MRRKARLKVLYWPLFASAIIILILIGFGPLAVNVHPVVAKFWAGGDFGTKLQRWLPSGYFSSRSITLPWQDLAKDDGSRVHSTVSKPRTLLIQSEGRGLTGSAAALDARTDREPAVPRGMFSPHALRLEATSEIAELAQAKLQAPRRSDTEELAGVERVARPFLQLASQPSLDKTAEGDTANAGKLQTRVHIGDDVRDTTKRIAEPARRGHGLGGGWPETPQLVRELELLSRVAARNGNVQFASSGLILGERTVGTSVLPNGNINEWKSSVVDSLAALTALPSVSSPEAGEVLARLQSLAASGHEAGEATENRELQIQLLNTAYAIDRRVAIWNSVWRTTQSTVTRASDLGIGENEALIASAEAHQLIQSVRTDVLASDDPEGWSEFLMLDELETVNQGADADARRIAAQRFLSRLSWHRLSDEHRAWLDRQSVRNLAITLRRWAATPLDYSALLGQIERQESDSIDLGGIDVASAVQTLRFAESHEANRIAQSLNTHYRNSNIRIAITSELVQRMIPEVDARVQPVRDSILGADVRGTSVVHSDLGLRLVPSDHTWKMVLENNGRIDTGASSRQWPVLIRSDSNASFLSSTPLEITPDGAITGATDVAVDAATRVRGMQTEFDSIPVISTLVREIAMDRYHSMAPVAQQIQKSKIRSGVSDEVDGRVAEQLDEAAETLARRLIGPLSTLRLSPLVVDMQTTSTRLSARYRVAGDWQLAAFTPRPRAPLSSLMSVQLHQSVFNNTLETILPAGETQSIADMVERIREVFAIEAPLLLGDDDELAKDTTIQFASTRPVTVEIEDDILWITMRVMRLKQGRAIDLRRFIVRAAYRPQVDGMSATLVRDGHLRISGPDMSMRDRLPVRAIFNKVFSTKKTLPLIPERWSSHSSLKGLAVTQVELRDGWMAIAIGNASDAVVVPQIARSEEVEMSMKY